MTQPSTFGVPPRNAVAKRSTSARPSSAPVSPSSTSVAQLLSDEPISPIKAQIDAIHLKRKLATEAQISQAERMVKRSRIIMVAGEVGDNVTVPVPLVDRGRSDPRNILGVIQNRDENDLYTIAVKGGILKGKFSRNQFDLCAFKLITETDLNLNELISLRQAVQYESKCGGQGFVKCNCAGNKRCQSNRCKCFKAKVKCNSRCHFCLSCSNKA